MYTRVVGVSIIRLFLQCVIGFWNCSNSVVFVLVFIWFFTNKWDLWSDRFRICMLLCCDQSIKGVSRLLTASTIINDQSIMQIIALFFSLKFLDSCTGLNDFELFKCTNQTPYSIHTHTHTHTALISFYSLVIFSFVCYLLKLYFSCFEWNNNCIYRRRRHKLVRLVCDPVCIIDQIK
jgi:hypothetical protein